MELSSIRNCIKMPHFFTVAPFIIGKYREEFVANVEMLYHYTNLDGFKGIIEGKSFWASDIRFLNDSTEFIHGRDLCLECVESLCRDNPGSDGLTFLEGLRDLLTASPFLWGDIDPRFRLFQPYELAWVIEKVLPIRLRFSLSKTHT